jgi:hypothetical protein
MRISLKSALLTGLSCICLGSGTVALVNSLDYSPESSFYAGFAGATLPILYVLGKSFNNFLRSTYNDPFWKKEKTKAN